jgi:O-methyltransferase involved in polyketide biosynthesis
VTTDATVPADDVVFVKVITAPFAATGEPWLSRFHPESLMAKLTDMGFQKISHLTPEAANRRYFQNRRDRLNASFFEQMMRATA